MRVIELAGLAPAPFCGMILADFGAEVIRVDRTKSGSTDNLARGKKSICINLQKEEGKEVLRKLIKVSDVLIEPFRPGVMEKLGFSEEDVIAINQRIIYVRLTGFGQTGTLTKKAGHDINYISMSGALSSIRAEAGGRPIPPVNILGDFAGGGFLAALGVLLALQERSKSGLGQVIDANMVDGSAYLSTFLFKNAYLIGQPSGSGVLDGGAPFYRCYETRDHKWMAVGAIEPQFFAQLLKGLEIKNDEVDQMNTEKWPEYEKKFQKFFLSRTLEEWETIFENLDACVCPVLELQEVMKHPHNQQRQTLVKNSDGDYEPPPAPRLGRTPGRRTPAPLPLPGADTVSVMKNILGVLDEEIAQLEKKGAVKTTHLKANL
uniref:Alpha-methylacyl-CoA racemase n=1 Tax=Paramoeba aestuarina TaxID=180227 RepID=A0A7S4NRW5_9EUKA